MLENLLMEIYKDVKVYFDGSHNIGIPYLAQPQKKRKMSIQKDKIITQNENEYAEDTLPIERENEVSKQKLENKKIEIVENLKLLFDKLYEANRDKKRKEKFELILTEIKKHLNEEKATEFVKINFERKFRNLIERRKRFVRKVRQQQWDYFCTFTYNDKLHNETTFRKSLSNCFKHFASRKDWKYVGVWERSPEKQRLHFHGLFKIPNMVGEFEEIKDYSTKNHQMQVAMQNTYFLKKFGRNDFKKVEHQSILDQSIQYLMKYLEKSGEKIVYSKGLYTYFVTDILGDDVACTIGQEDRKILLFDNFKCWDLDTGELIGNISEETKHKLKKSN